MMSASVMMAISAGSLNNSCGFIHFICPPTGTQDFTCGSYQASCSAWLVPATAVLPLAYWIIFQSISAYFLLTWANRYARAGYILAYTALQPFTSTLLSVILILSGVQGLQMPGWNVLGSIGIFLGLILLILDGKRQHEADQATLPSLRESLGD
mmetsp:Transcript_67833/g.148910  ORF Transcript_67833/g.148910 Transcript_67833/m.148910 type:complete len:154 (+) Transcript_67833:657-1118(+)